MLKTLKIEDAAALMTDLRVMAEAERLAARLRETRAASGVTLARSRGTHGLR